MEPNSTEPTGPKQPKQPTPTPSAGTGAPEQKRKQPSHGVLLFWTFVVGIVVFLLGLAFLIYSGTPIFAIPLVVSVPVIAAVAFRNMWD
jgi:hypothetical protein